MATITEPYYWPECLEDDEVPSFVSHDDCETWTPLCDTGCGAEMTYRFTPWTNWDCPRCGMRYLIWAEDWPDYDDEEED